MHIGGKVSSPTSGRGVALDSAVLPVVTTKHPVEMFNLDEQPLASPTPRGHGQAGGWGSPEPSLSPLVPETFHP